MSPADSNLFSQRSQEVYSSYYKHRSVSLQAMSWRPRSLGLLIAYTVHRLEITDTSRSDNNYCAVTELNTVLSYRIAAASAAAAAATSVVVDWRSDRNA